MIICIKMTLEFKADGTINFIYVYVTIEVALAGMG